MSDLVEHSIAVIIVNRLPLIFNSSTSSRKLGYSWRIKLLFVTRLVMFRQIQCWSFELQPAPLHWYIVWFFGRFPNEGVWVAFFPSFWISGTLLCLSRGRHKLVCDKHKFLIEKENLRSWIRLGRDFFIPKMIFVSFLIFVKWSIFVQQWTSKVGCSVLRGISRTFYYEKRVFHGSIWWAAFDYDIYRSLVFCNQAPIRKKLLVHENSTLFLDSQWWDNFYVLILSLFSATLSSVLCVSLIHWNMARCTSDCWLKKLFLNLFCHNADSPLQKIGNFHRNQFFIISGIERTQNLRKAFSIIAPGGTFASCVCSLSGDVLLLQNSMLREGPLALESTLVSATGEKVCGRAIGITWLSRI